MDIEKLLETLIAKTEIKKLQWKASNTMGRYEVDVKNGVLAIDSSFNPQEMYFRLFIIDKFGNLFNTYRFPKNSSAYKTIEKLYQIVNEQYNDEFIKRIIDEM